MYNSGKLKYEGQFQDGKYHGEGKLYDESDKLRYQGQFQDGNYHGEGKLYDDEGVFYEGTFQYGVVKIHITRII